MTRYLTAIILILLSGSIAIFFIDPKLTEIDQTRAQREQTKLDLADAATLDAKYREIQARYNAMPQNTDDALRTIVPDTIDPLRMIMNIDDIASKHSLPLRTPIVEKDAKTETFDGVPYRVTKITFAVKATYAEFLSFLLDLEQSVVLREPAGVEFSSALGKDGTTEYTILLTGYSLE